ncbi:MAG: glycoside hydrolase family 16 protein [Cyclobacteriaceae bacterium]
MWQIETSTDNDFPANEILKAGYILDFNEGFNQNIIDTSKWIPYYLPQWSSREKSRPNYKLANGQLILKITEDQEPWCSEFNGEIKCSSLQTGLFSGEVGTTIGQHRFNPLCIVRESQKTARLYTPLYGYIEIRARVEMGSNNVAAFWMIGFEETPEKSGEICIMEVKGENIKNNQFVNGYGIHPFGDMNLKEEFFEDKVDFDPSVFNIYAAKWQPNQVDFYINNKLIRTINQSPNYVMQLMLNIYEIPTEQKETGPYPKRFIVEYIRGYTFKE